jgi:hypothetical protein
MGWNPTRETKKMVLVAPWESESLESSSVRSANQTRSCGRERTLVTESWRGRDGDILVMTLRTINRHIPIKPEITPTSSPCNTTIDIDEEDDRPDKECNTIEGSEYSPSHLRAEE